MSVRQQDIAAHLGLSVSTVSLALRDAAQVAQETRVRVRDAALQLGYNYRPRQLMRTEVAQMAFITRIDPNNVFYGAVLTGAERECRSLNIALHYTRLDNPDSRMPSHFSDADALLVVGTIDEATVMRLKDLGRPIVLLDNNLPQLGLDRVLTENYGSIYRVVKRMVGWGHRRIAFMAGPEDHPSFHDRLLGYQAAVTDLDLPSMVLWCGSTRHGNSKQVIGEWMDAHDQADFSALLVFHDSAAIEAIHELQDRGLRVPEDIAVVGFDDIDAARIVRPALTTCHVHRELLGALGVRRLIERAADPKAPALALTVDTVFVERASARAPK
jgi:DNA-binding LacI/PurR family transcriptional regulator